MRPFWLQAIAIVAWAAAGIATSSKSQDVVEQVQTLGQKLSHDAQIIPPCSDQFGKATLRWSTLDEPQPNIVVVPATEDDVVQTVSTDLITGRSRKVSDLFGCRSNSPMTTASPSSRTMAPTALSPPWET